MTKLKVPIENQKKTVGLISDEDYKQVFEETYMAMIEGIVNLAQKAKIKDAKKILHSWIDYYWDKTL